MTAQISEDDLATAIYGTAKEVNGVVDMGYVDDPLGFVLYAFPWGEGPLAGFTGPDAWAIDALRDIERAVKANSFNGVDAVPAVRMATASGHGIGKTAITAWLILWLMSTRPHCKGIVTANTSSQLETKTWAELAKWQKMCVTGHWFKLNSGKMSMRIAHVAHPETWRCDAQTCREENSEAFAGLHAANSSPFYIFDEACHDDQTDVMTARGWIRFKDVTPDDLLLTPEGWQAPIAIHASHRTGVMKSIERRGLSMLVTPNHDLWLKSRKTGKMRKRRADEISLNEEMSPRIVWVSQEEYPVSDDQLTLDAWYYSEGHLIKNNYTPKNNGKGAPVIGREWYGFGITNAESRGIPELLDRLNLKWTEAASSTRQWLVYEPELAERYAAQGKNCLEKTIPGWMFKLSQRQARLFLDVYAEGDGYRKGDKRVIYTSCKKMADDLHALACLAGFNSSLTVRALTGKRTWIKDHWAVSSADGYAITLSETGAGASIGRQHLKDVPYDGMVYCATVPAGLLFTRRNGTVIWSGNSAVPDKIWEVAEGGMTDGEPFWLVFGNPTRNTGRFRECFGRFRHRWITRQVDSRTVKISNKTQIEEWLRDYGEDSDFFRIRVRGVFPRAASTQFISSEVAELAASHEREPAHSLYDPRIMGVDVARFGDDSSVIRIRIGRDARSVKPIKLRGVDTMQLAARVVEEAEKHKVDAIFVDGGGAGGGVVDRLRYLRQPVHEVQFGGKADRATMNAEGSVVYANKRAEMWGSMRDWLATGCIDNDPELLSDLTGVEYGFVLRDGRDAILLEKKEDMKKRGLASPDNGDALALTFAYPVASSDHYQEMSRGRGHEFDYDGGIW